MKKTRNTCISCILILALLLPNAARAQEKSPGKAALLSLLLPGTGEHYAGGRRSSRFFLFTEGLFWTGLFAFRFLESTRTDTYRSYAAAHAGVPLADKSESFIEEVALFESIYERNTRERFLAGDLANLRPETPGQIWEWDTEASRLKFQDLRSKSTSAEQKAFLFVGALIFNRFASALNAASIARTTRPTTTPKLELEPLPQGGLKASLRTSF
ncbi:MAG: hypothetical protein O2954_09080 [bacterium]|nr:hypothetical protein [bacterium]